MYSIKVVDSRENNVVRSCTYDVEDDINVTDFFNHILYKIFIDYGFIEKQWDNMVPYETYQEALAAQGKDVYFE